jgi:hypothetical protein
MFEGEIMNADDYRARRERWGRKLDVENVDRVLT